ncbi:S1 domain-containing protein [Candidatus Nanopusillus massiliensis]|nr:hypothetical protein [Candidatus Nanopusillus massiliensis]
MNKPFDPKVNKNINIINNTSISIFHEDIFLNLLTFVSCLLLFKLEFSDVIFRYFNKRFKNYFTITYSMPRKVVSKTGEEGIRNAEENVVKENIVTWTKGYKAEVLDVVGRTGMRGEATHFIVRILDGPDSGKILRRNGNRTC